MKRKMRSIIASAFLVFVILGIGGTHSPASATQSIEDFNYLPPFLGNSGVKPNILFILDFIYK